MLSLAGRRTGLMADGANHAHNGTSQDMRFVPV